MELDPKQTVSYTNRALCYIRINQPEKAEQDCTAALSIEKDNVKALFRRAQAKKVLEKIHCHVKYSITYIFSYIIVEINSEKKMCMDQISLRPIFIDC